MGIAQRATIDAPETLTPRLSISMELSPAFSSLSAQLISLAKSKTPWRSEAFHGVATDATNDTVLTPVAVTPFNFTD